MNFRAARGFRRNGSALGCSKMERAVQERNSVARIVKGGLEIETGDGRGAIELKLSGLHEGAKEPQMQVLYGIEAPSGDGMVIEVHLDIMEAPVAFLDRLRGLGFESDPFLEFYPAAYKFHYTGRTRAASTEVRKALPDINRLIGQVIEEAGEAKIEMYAECELVREIRHFADDGLGRGLSALAGMAFRKGPAESVAKADVHVEFRSGTVPSDLRALLIENEFYWVSTPASERFPAEEIATLQTGLFYDAQQIYERLVAAPLPACTGVHLEQKLLMVPSRPGLPMPGVVELAAA